MRQEAECTSRRCSTAGPPNPSPRAGRRHFPATERRFLLPLHRKITAQPAVVQSDEPTDRPAHPAQQHLPRHHLFRLRRSDDSAAGSRKRLVGRAANRRADSLRSPARGETPARQPQPAGDASDMSRAHAARKDTTVSVRETPAEPPQPAGDASDISRTHADRKDTAGSGRYGSSRIHAARAATAAAGYQLTAK